VASNWPLHDQHNRAIDDARHVVQFMLDVLHRSELPGPAAAWQLSCYAQKSRYFDFLLLGLGAAGSGQGPALSCQPATLSHRQQTGSDGRRRSFACRQPPMTHRQQTGSNGRRRSFACRQPPVLHRQQTGSNGRRRIWQ
jgi:hypothetical protein